MYLLGNYVIVQSKVCKKFVVNQAFQYKVSGRAKPIAVAKEFLATAFEVSSIIDCFVYELPTTSCFYRIKVEGKRRHARTQGGHRYCRKRYNPGVKEKKDLEMIYS